MSSLYRAAGRDEPLGVPYRPLSSVPFARSHPVPLGRSVTVSSATSSRIETRGTCTRRPVLGAIRFIASTASTNRVALSLHGCMQFVDPCRVPLPGLPSIRILEQVHYREDTVRLSV